MHQGIKHYVALGQAQYIVVYSISTTYGFTPHI